MRDFGLLLKSYRKDAPQAERLVASYRQFAAPDIPLAVVVPEPDIPLFKAFIGGDAEVLSESEFSQHLVSEPVAGLRPGYVNQEIVKLAFHELEVFRNYFTVDSEAEFIRPFDLSDFIDPNSYPYSVLVEDRDLMVEPDYYSSYWESREEAHLRIWDVVGVEDPVVRTCHGHTTLSSDVLRSFVKEFLASQGWTYKDAIEFAPYEYTWYNAWLLKSKVIPINPRDPIIKVFHTESQLLTSLAQGIGRDELSRGYVGVVLNGSFDQGRSLSHSLDDRLHVLPHYLSTREILALLKARLRIDFGDMRSKSAKRP